jgi:uncharacterized damage-inducible protein DinB
LHGRITEIMADTPAYSLADAWQLNNRVNLMLLDAMTEEQLGYVPSPRARSIADQFAHLHNVRIQWLEVQAPATLSSLQKIGKGVTGKDALKTALEVSSKAFADMFTAAVERGKLRGAKRGVYAFFAYAIAHEGHHRGQILAHLKHGGMTVDRALGYQLWEWEKI